MIPGCTYCSPQIASVGLTEQAAREKEIDIRVGHFPFVGNGKAILCTLYVLDGVNDVSPALGTSVRLAL